MGNGARMRGAGEFAVDRLVCRASPLISWAHDPCRHGPPKTAGVSWPLHLQSQSEQLSPKREARL